MNSFYETATRLLERGYSIIPIIPGEKRPGEWDGKQWHGMIGWQRFCSKAPTQAEIEEWATWPECGICVALGLASNLTAIDFDYGTPAVREALETLIPPSPVRKKGAKGYTTFLRGHALTSRKYTHENMSVIEILSDGRQTVLPPSKHPDGMNYVWLTQDTLEEMSAYELPELPLDLHDHIQDVLKFYGEIPDKKKIPSIADETKEETYWRKLNNAALQNLSKWVPSLTSDYRSGASGGYRIRCTWRGKMENDTYKVGVNPSGIVDFGSGQKMTPIDLAMAAMECDIDTAIQWLNDKLDRSIDPVEIEAEDGVRQSITQDGEVIDIPNVPTEINSEAKNRAPTDGLLKAKDVMEPKGAIRMFCEYINATSYRLQPILTLGAVLCAMGTLAGRKYTTPTGWRSNLYVVGLAASGAGKDHARRTIDDLFMNYLDLGQRLGGDKIASGSGLLTAINRSPSILFQIDEFGAVLRGIANQERAPAHLAEVLFYLTQMFTSSGGIFKGIEYANQKERPRVILHEPCVSLYGTTVPSHFWKALENNNAEDGSIARFLALETDKNYPPHRSPIPLDPSPDLIDLLKRIAEPVPGIMDLNASMPIDKDSLKKVPFDREAAAMEKAFKVDTDVQLDRYQETQFGSFWARRIELINKVAMLHAVGCNPEDPVINPYDLMFARSVIDRSINLFISGVSKYVSDNQAEATVKKTIEIVRRAGKHGIVRSDLCKKTYFLGRDRENVMKTVLESCEVIAIPVETKGRTKVIYKHASYE